MFEWSDIVTIILLVLLEGLLSADNALVLAVLVLGLPKHQQKNALGTESWALSSFAPSRRCSRSI